MSNLIEHAKQEFLIAGYKPIDMCEDDPNKWMQENILELLKVFSKQGHSGASAGYAIQYFTKLANFDLISPLTGEDSEWGVPYNDSGSMQNKRLSSVFKDGKGVCTYGNALAFKDEKGSCWSGHALFKGKRISSSQPIHFPFIGKTFYIDVVEKEDNFFIKDEKQLNEALDYFKEN